MRPVMEPLIMLTLEKSKNMMITGLHCLLMLTTN